MALTPGRRALRGRGAARRRAGPHPAARTTCSRRSRGREVAAQLHVARAGRDAARAGRSSGQLTRGGGRAGRALPVAEDITVEADSGGHTDNRPLVALFPTILALRDELAAAARLRTADPRRRRRRPRHAGARSPRRSRSGAAYVVTGSVNQARRRVRARPTTARRMLAEAEHRRRDDGAGRRHVRAGRQGAGAQARHDVRRARRQALRALPRLRRPGGASRPTCAPSWRTSVLRRPLDAGLGRDPGVLAERATRRRSRAPSATRSTAWRWCSAGTSGMSSRWAIDGDAGAARRLPDLVRPGDGRVQRLGARARSSSRAANRTRGRRSRSTCSRARPSITRAQQLRSLRRARARRARSTSRPRRSPERSTIIAEARTMSSAPAPHSPPIAVVGVGALFPGSHRRRRLLARHPRGQRPHHRRPARRHWLIEDYYDPDPAGARQDLRQARRASSPDVDFDPLEFGIPPTIVPGHRHRPAARADRRASRCSTTRRSGQFAERRPRAHQRASSASLGARSCSARW